MVASVDVLTVGYVGDRVAGTVTLIRDGDMVTVVDPGMVASRRLILDPLESLGIAPDAVTDVVFSHHHPDHTLNAALFPAARYHDILATYQDDLWIDRMFDPESGFCQLSPSVRLLLTPGHSAEDIATVVQTGEGTVICTHAWWSSIGPAMDPYALDQATLQASREKLLALQPILIIPGHGGPFVPGPATPV